MHERGILRNTAVLPQLEHGLVHQLHALLRAGLQNGGECVGLALTNDVGHGDRVNQYFGGNRQAVDRIARDEFLADDAAQALGGHRADLLLLVRRKDVEQPVQRGGRVAGVQRTDHEMSGLGCGDRHFDRLEITQLADHNDIRILTQSAFERAGKRLGVAADFPLGDIALLRLVDNLNRFLDRDDVVFALAVDDVDQRRERRRLAAADRTGHQDKPVVMVKQLGDRFSVAKAEFREGHDPIRHQAIGPGNALLVNHQVDAEPAAVGHRQRKVQIFVGLELGALAGGQQDRVEFCRSFRRQWPVGDRLDLQVQAYEGDGHGRKVQVAGAHAAANGQELTNDFAHFAVRHIFNPVERRQIACRGAHRHRRPHRRRR